MQISGYLVAAYVVVWVGLLLYLGSITLRTRSLRTELTAIEELAREQQKPVE